MFFGVKWPSVVAAGGFSVSAVARLDPESGRQNVRETVARARFHIKNRKKITGILHILKMRSTKCARDCCESSISYVNHIVTKELIA